MNNENGQMFKGESEEQADLKMSNDEMTTQIEAWLFRSVTKLTGGGGPFFYSQLYVFLKF